MPNRLAKEKWGAWHSISTSRGWKVFDEEAQKKMNYYDWELTHNEMLSGEQMKNCQLILKGMRMVMSIPRQLENKSKLTNTRLEIASSEPKGAIK